MSPPLSRFTLHFRAYLITSKRETDGSERTIGQPLRRIVGLIAVVDGAAPRSPPVSGSADTSTSETLFKLKSVSPRVHLRTDAVCYCIRGHRCETDDGGMDF